MYKNNLSYYKLFNNEVIIIILAGLLAHGLVVFTDF
jgi:hypothetical protein